MAASVFTQSRIQHRDMSGINITPLVDVMLVLLIIFMVQSIPRSQALDMSVSQGRTTNVTPPPRTRLSVGLDEDLRSELGALKLRAPDTTLSLETNEGADYGLFARVLADARNAGFADVALRP